MNTCKNCRHLGPSNWMHAPVDWHSCEAMHRQTEQNLIPSGALAHLDPTDADDGARFLVSPDFGCLMHEPQAETT